MKMNGILMTYVKICVEKQNHRLRHRLQRKPNEQLDDCHYFSMKHKENGRSHSFSAS